MSDSSTLAKREHRYYPDIDYLRLACSFAVVLFHLAAASSKRTGLAPLIMPPGFEVPGGSIFGFGSVGVEIFFVISGFVIAASSVDVNASTFVRHRALRLYPAVLICAPISALLWHLVGRPHVLSLLIKSLLLVPAGAWIDAPYWTLGCEIGFYSLIFVVIISGAISHLERIAAALVFASATYWIVQSVSLFGLQPPDWTSFPAHFKPIPLYYGIYFGLGILIQKRKRDKLSSFGFSATLLAFMCGIFASSQVLEHEASLVRGFVWACGVVIIFVARPSSGPSNRIARLAGLTTYPLYLVHFALGLFLLKEIIERGISIVVALIATITILTVFSLVIAIFFEPRIKAIIRVMIDWSVIRLIPRFCGS